MFERFTEKARRVIFFARYEASLLGSGVLDVEHLLLGLLREDKRLYRFFPAGESALEAIRRGVESAIQIRERVPASIEIPMSAGAKRVLRTALEESEQLGHKMVGAEHLLLSLIRERNSTASRLLQENGLRVVTLREQFAAGAPPVEDTSKQPKKKKDTPLLLDYSRDLTERAALDELDPLIGRAEELERLIQILCRRTRNNPVLIGEPGVGKTALVEGLAKRIVSGEAPSFLAGKRILALDLSLVVAGTKYRGQFEERLKGLLKELTDNRDIIVFVDEVHTLVGAGSAEGSLDAANILKPALSRGELQCIGSTTPAEYRRTIGKDRSLERRFQPVRIEAPDEAESERILMGVKSRYESFHTLTYADDAVKAAVHLSSRYITDRALPDKALDVLDEAGARVKLRLAASEAAPEEATAKKLMAEQGLADIGLLSALPKPAQRTAGKPLDGPAPEERPVFPVVEAADVEEVVARWTGVPVTRLQEGEAQKLLRMENELHRRIVGQNEAVNALAKAIRRNRVGLRHPHRPVGCFLFLGPTGVGKTEVARRLAEFLFGSEQALLRVDMSEFMEKHSVAKWIGSPPGYVGHEDGGRFTERVRRNPYCVILLDEVEKAHPDVFNLLLQVMEDGRLTDSHGVVADFRHAIVIMTSNLGAEHLSKRSALGFSPSLADGWKRNEELVRSEMRKVFRPEFLNRLDEIIFFKPLETEELKKIVMLLVEDLEANLGQRGIRLALAPDAADFFVETTCADRSFGARPLRRAIQKHIEDPLAERIIRGEIPDGAIVEASLEGEELVFRLVDCPELSLCGSTRGNT